MYNSVIVWTFSSAEVIDDPMRQKNFVVDRDHVVTGVFIKPGYKLVFFNPSQPTGMCVCEFQEFLNTPKRGHLLIDPRHKTENEREFFYV